MTKQTAFERDVEFWGKRLNEETTCSLNSDARKLNFELGSLMYNLFEIQAKINTCEKKIRQNRFSWWYRYNLATRTMKKFKVRDIYKSPKALEYWSRWFPKCDMEFKGKTPIISDQIDNTNKNILIGLLQEMYMRDLVNKDKYIYVLNKLREDYDETNRY